MTDRCNLSCSPPFFRLPLVAPQFDASEYKPDFTISLHATSHEPAASGHRPAYHLIGTTATGQRKIGATESSDMPPGSVRIPRAP
jgi:hypothetical protein